MPKPAYGHWFAWAIAGLLSGCASMGPNDLPPLPSPGEPRIVDTVTGELLSPEFIGRKLSAMDVIYVGELHTRSSHHRVQRDLIAALLRSGVRPSIGLEMVEVKDQGLLDRWVAGALTESALRSLLHWEEGWGHDFGFYREVFDLARVHKLPIIALNAPRELVRRVGQVGREGLSPEEQKICPPLNTGTANHRKYIRGFYGGHHGGHAPSFEHFYTAQLVWDEFMANRVVEHVTARRRKGPLVVLAGRAHVEYAHGIPSRAANAGKISYRIVLPIATGHLSHYASYLRRLSYPAKRADYFWEAPGKIERKKPVSGPSPHHHTPEHRP